MRINMRFPGGRLRALTLSYDDDVQTDKRLIEIMKANGLKGTFNINSGLYYPEGKEHPAGEIQRFMSRSESYEAFKDSGMEVACHGFTHPFFEKLNDTQLTYEIMGDRIALEKTYGQIVRGMAYPFGTYDDRVVEFCRKCGIAYARTTQSTSDFYVPTDPLKFHPTCHHNDPRLMELLNIFLSPRSEDNAPWIFYLWGHSYEFDGDNNWNVIEDFAKAAGGHDNVWYATNIEIVDYINAYRSLIFSADSSMVSNPSCMDVWFYIAGSCVEKDHLELVKAGETKEVTTT